MRGTNAARSFYCPVGQLPLHKRSTIATPHFYLYPWPLWLDVTLLISRVPICCLNILKTLNCSLQNRNNRDNCRGRQNTPQNQSTYLHCEINNRETGRTAGWVGKELTAGNKTTALVSFLAREEKKFCIYPYALKKILMYKGTE